jgi:hypothetical protein
VHLSGEDEHRQPFVAGVYPLCLDEFCYFLAADFDKANWQDDAAAFLHTCQRFDLDAALERSRSGRGGHVWIFFEQAIPAALARRLGSHLLTETMDERPDVGMDSYDGLFPNQDTLPPGGFGNLIALPLQKGPRERGHSVFLAERLVPWDDQWSYLSRIHKVGRAQVEHLVQQAERRGRILGVRLPPQEDGDDTPWTTPPSRRHRVRRTLEDLGICPTFRDERHTGRPLDLTFQGELRRDQQVAANAILAHDTGVLAATTAFGKTVVGAWLIAKRGVSTLVLVHRRQLLDQWVARLSTFLGVPAKSIGRIGEVAIRRRACWMSPSFRAWSRTASSMTVWPTAVT